MKGPLEERIHLDQNVLGFEIAVGHPLCAEVAEAVEYLSQSAEISVVANDAYIDDVSKGIVGHDDRGLHCLPKFKHLYYIRLYGD